MSSGRKRKISVVTFSFLIILVIITLLLMNDLSNKNELISTDLSLLTQKTSFSNEMPINGEEITITTEISNNGDIDATAKICFYDGTPGANNMIGTDQIFVPKQGISKAEIDWKITNSNGNRKIFIQIEDSNPSDLDNSNNLVSLDLQVGFKIHLYPGKNSICLPILASETALDLCNSINDQGGSCTRIEKFDAQTKEWISYSSTNTSQSNFNIEPFMGLNIYPDHESDFIIYGKCLETENLYLLKGWNFIGFPMFEDIYASELGEMIGKNCQNIAWNDPSTGSNKAFIPGVSGPEEDFLIKPGYGLLIYVEEDSNIIIGR